MILRKDSNTQKNYTKKDLHNPYSHDVVITYPESDNLEYKVKWDLESITTKRANGGHGWSSS